MSSILCCENCMHQNEGFCNYSFILENDYLDDGLQQKKCAYCKSSDTHNQFFES